MKRFLMVQMETGNDAMRTRRHVADALRMVAVKIEEGREEGKIMDENGNSVGWFELSDKGGQS